MSQEKKNKDLGKRRRETRVVKIRKEDGTQVSKYSLGERLVSLRRQSHSAAGCTLYLLFT